MNISRGTSFAIVMPSMKSALWRMPRTLRRVTPEMTPTMRIARGIPFAHGGRVVSDRDGQAVHQRGDAGDAREPAHPAHLERDEAPEGRERVEVWAACAVEAASDFGIGQRDAQHREPHEDDGDGAPVAELRRHERRREEDAAADDDVDAERGEVPASRARSCRAGSAALPWRLACESCASAGASISHRVDAGCTPSSRRMCCDAIVTSILASPCAAETKPASNGEGAR